MNNREKIKLQNAIPDDESKNDVLKDLIPEDYKPPKGVKIELDDGLIVRISSEPTESDKKAEAIRQREREKYLENHGHYPEEDGIEIAVYL